MTTAYFRLFALTLTLSTASLPASAQESRNTAMRREVFDKLGLTPAQKAQLKQLHEQKQPQEQELRRQLTDARNALAEALVSPDMRPELTALHEVLAQKREAYAAYRFEGLLEVRKILGSDQRKRFGELYLEFRRNWAQGKSNGE